MPLDKEASVYRIITLLINPAISEMRDFLKHHRTMKVCRILYGSDYYNLYYYISKLCRKARIVRLRCESGYRNRYSISVHAKKYKKRLDSCCQHVRQEQKAVNVYKIGIEEFQINIHANIHQTAVERGNTFLALCDSELWRYYIVLNNCFLGVVRREDEKNPRLPGFTYGLGTEYSRCFHRFRKLNPHGILTLVGHRKATGGR